MTGVNHALVQQIFATAKEAYLTDIYNHTKNYINITVNDLLNRLQDNYGQLIPHKLLKRKEIVNNTTYYLQ